MAEKKTCEILNQVEQKSKRKSNVNNKKGKAKDVSDDASIDKIDSFQQQALEIREPGPDFDPTAPPRDGDEYLMHMLYERKKCPAIVVKEPNACIKNITSTVLTENLKNGEDALKSIPYPGVKPTKEWKKYQLTDFEETRKKVVLLRLQLLRENYDPSLEPTLTTDASSWRQFCQENPPYLKIILRFSQRTLEKLLEYICNWLREGEDSENSHKLSSKDVTGAGADETVIGDDDNVANSDAAAGADGVADHDAGAADDGVEDDVAMSSTSNETSNQNADANVFDLTGTESWLGQWLYAALSCLHIPIEPEVHSTLRDIARVCMRLRGRLTQNLAEKSIPYNLFILIVAKAFGQGDFAEFV